MLNIYFTASITGDGENKPIYKKILNSLHGNKIISGKQTIDKKIVEKDRSLDPEEIFKRQKELIEQADLVIAEVTKPSHGVGGEIVYALTHNIPVLALLQAEHEDTISPMVAGNPSDNFFIENYKTENIRFILKDFLTHIQKIKKRKGHLIVIDGGDGSGKGTQAKLLVDYLKKQRIPVKYFDFPQYYSSFHGKTVAQFLRGEFGSIDQVSPYLASLAYALDRASVKREMEEFLQKGGYIVANRYATSNMAHQGAKFLNKKDREAYLKWDYDLEYKVHKIPKEDIVIYLYVPWQTAQKLTAKKTSRTYLQGKAKDIHEKDDSHIQKAEEMYIELSKRYKHWVLLDCVKNNSIDSIANIHKKILEILYEKKIIIDL